MSTTGDPLNADQQAAFERYIQAGGGYAGVHAAADTEYDWHWYGGLVGAYFRNHPAGTPTATVLVDDPDHHSTVGLPSPWPRVDEWYNYRAPDGSSPGRLQPADGGRPRPPEAGRVDLRGGRRQRDGRRPSDLVVPALRRRPLVVHGHGPHAGLVLRGAFRRHLFGGLEVAAGVVKDADCGVQNQPPTVTAIATPASGRRRSR